MSMIGLPIEVVEEYEMEFWRNPDIILEAIEEEPPHSVYYIYQKFVRSRKVQRRLKTIRETLKYLH